MREDAPAYAVEDRSILLPHYRRWLVDPALRWVPARLSPNTITHAGQALCLASLLVLVSSLQRGVSPRGWQMAASALLLHAYLWCDNADGAHARRTGQASTAGEYLDHGLDLVNCVYIGIVSTVTIDMHLETPGLAIACIIPCAAAITVWEQAVTGVFRLGLLNQIESLVFLTGVMAVDAAFGFGLVRETIILGFAARSWIWLFVFASVSFGILRSCLRVHAAKKSVVAGLSLLGFLGAVWFAHAHGLATAVAYLLSASGIVAFGARMLRLRILRREIGPLVAFVPAAAACALSAAMHAAPSGAATPVAVALASGAALLAAIDAQLIARRATETTAAAAESTKAAG